MKYYSAGQHRSLVIQNKTSNVVENIVLAGTDAQDMDKYISAGLLSIGNSLESCSCQKAVQCQNWRIS